MPACTANPLQTLNRTLTEQIRALEAQKGFGPDADAEVYRRGMIAAYVNARAHVRDQMPATLHPTR